MNHAGIARIRVTRQASYKRAHLIGIAGSGMRALADVLQGQGWLVTGSDLAPTSARQEGIYCGHAPEQVPLDVDLVVHSEAVDRNNCECRRGLALGAQVVSYPEMLGRITEKYRTFAVAGTHGKSTTAAMAAHILQAAGIDPTVLVGAVPHGKNSGGHAGRGEIAVVEACEYRSNFRYLLPETSVILGIEPDHFDSFSNDAQLRAAFEGFAQQTAPAGLLLANADCSATMAATSQLQCRCETFGLRSGADWQSVNRRHQRGRYRFQLALHHRILGEVRLGIPGRHNVLNALAAAALAYDAGASAKQICQGLSTFQGLQRRLQVAGEIQGITWIDDYAHHPTAVTATLETVRRMAPGRRIYTVFQPHQASRLARLAEPFGVSLLGSDRIWIADIFRAREKEISPAIGSRNLAEIVERRGGQVASEHNLETIADQLQDAISEGELTPGDVIVTMGAGNIGKIGYDICNRTRKLRKAG